jgi:hypothetical protein
MLQMVKMGSLVSLYKEAIYQHNPQQTSLRDRGRQKKTGKYCHPFLAALYRHDQD